MTDKLNAKPLIEQVRAWLSTHGAPYEMKIARLFQSAGYSCVQGSSYADNESGKMREIDVIARKMSFLGNSNVIVQRTFVVECKGRQNKPWVLFMNSPEVAASYQQLFSSPAVGNATGAVLMANAGVIDGIATHGFVHGPKNTAYSGVSAFRNHETDEAYSAPIVAVKAAMWLKQRAGDGTPLAKVLNKHEASVWFPIVVIDEDLFSATLDDAGELLVEPLGWGRMKIEMPNSQAGGSIVDVVTTAALGPYLSVAESDFKGIMAAVEANPKMATESLAWDKVLEQGYAALAKSQRVKDASANKD